MLFRSPAKSYQMIERFSSLVTALFIGIQSESFSVPSRMSDRFTPDSPDQPAGCGCIVYTPNNNPSIAKFGIFQNGNLIASSTKSLSCNGSVLDLSLQAIAKVTAGQSIDVKWNTDTEEIALGNRTLTITKVATGD